MYRIKWAALCFALSLPSILLAQSSDNIPVNYDQFLQNYFLLNPSLKNANENFGFGVGNRTLTGLFEGVNRFYADANVLVNAKRDERYHSLGALAISNRDGEFFQRNRLYVRYSFRTPLNERSAISLGISGGLINYVFKGSQASAGGSSFRPDANIGGWYHREKLDFGISLQQFTQPSLQPLNQVYKLPSYLNFNLHHNLYLTQDISLHSHLYGRFQKDSPLHTEIVPVLLFYEKIEAGANYQNDKGVAVLAGLRSIKINNGEFRFMASYLLSFYKLSGLNNSVLELSLGYSVIR